MIRHLALATLVLCLQTPVGAHAQSRACPQQEADAAENMVDGIKTWADVDVMNRRYRRCDEGSISEGTSAAVANILTRRWDDLPKLSSLIRADPSLRPFVLNHVNRTLATQDLERIRSSAASSCPTEAASLCASVRRAADLALRP